MECRKCGTAIAEKAIICYKCGTATAAPSPEARPRAQASGSRVPGWVWIVGAGIVAGLIWWQWR